MLVGSSGNGAMLTVLVWLQVCWRRGFAQSYVSWARIHTLMIVSLRMASDDVRQDGGRGRDFGTRCLASTKSHSVQYIRGLLKPFLYLLELKECHFFCWQLGVFTSTRPEPIQANLCTLRGGMATFGFFKQFPVPLGNNIVAPPWPHHLMPCTPPR